MNKMEALTQAIQFITRSGHNAVMIDHTDDGWRAWDTANDVFPDYVGWTYEGGLDLPGVTDHTPMFDPAESLETVEQFLYHMPELETWLDDDTHDAIELAWTPVEDMGMVYDDDEGLYIDEDGELTDDNLAGHMYGMIRY